MSCFPYEHQKPLQSLSMNSAAWCCSWSSGEALQQAGSGSILFPTRLWPQVPHLPAGSACSFMAKTARLGRLPELRKAVRALAAAQVSCAMASLCLLSLSREGALVPGWRAWLRRGGAGSSRGTHPDLRLCGSTCSCGSTCRCGDTCRGDSTCRRKEGFVADMSCNVLLARKGYFEILQITTVGACHRVQPAVRAALASCRAWLFTDPSGRVVLAPFASSPPSAQAPTALRSTFLLVNSFQMRLKSLSWVWWFLGQNSSSL